MSFLDSIKAGMKFLGSHIWGALKSVFGSEQAKDISVAALNSAKALLASEVGAFIQKVVSELEASALDGPARLSQATTNVQDYLKQQGQTLPTVWIQWAIQTVLIFIRGLASPEATPPAV